MHRNEVRECASSLFCSARWPARRASISSAGGRKAPRPDPAQAENPAPRAQTVRVEAARVLSAQAQEEPIVLTVWDEGRAVRMDMEDYLIYAVAGEMPASYEMEALKAQAVAARSYLAWKMPAFGGGGCSQGVDTDVCTDSTHCMAYWSEAEMRERWGEAYAENRARIEEAVRATAGEVMLYNGSPIQALFHSASGGRPRTRRRSGARRIRI